MLLNKSEVNQVNLPLKPHTVNFSRKQIHNFLGEKKKKALNGYVKRTPISLAQPVLV